MFLKSVPSKTVFMFLLLHAVLLPQSGASLKSSREFAGNEGLKQLSRHLAGSFSSKLQAESDSTYYDVRLQMVPIWVDRTDAIWFYVEQAIASALDQPYRQRIYRLNRMGVDYFESKIYTIPDAGRFIGAAREPNPLVSLSPDSLELRAGCSILLRKDVHGFFSGGTIGDGCPSSLRGAAYATSEVSVEPERLSSWDRGFDMEGNQVWGAEDGAYVFDKVEDWSGRLSTRGGGADAMTDGSPICFTIIALTALASFVAFSRPDIVRDFAIAPWFVVRRGRWFQLVSSGFLHAGIGHLFFNMLTLFFFGPLMERVLGSGRFLVLYFGSLLAGNAITVLLHRNNPGYRAIGASGAVSGIVFSFILFQPFAPIYLFLIPIGIPAILFAIGYVAVSVYGTQSRRSGIGHSAHLGGAIGGVILTILLYPRVVEIFLSHF